MYTKEHVERINITGEIYEKYNLGELVFFDIETTGFDKNKDFIILISIGSFEEAGLLHVDQFFAEGRDEEEEILNCLKEALYPFKSWCSYNGIAFD